MGEGGMRDGSLRCDIPEIFVDRLLLQFSLSMPNRPSNVGKTLLFDGKMP
ncbi:MAG: hypothetical protein MAG451_03143 [Anaerolineales bacterium]|nr:hypothetical protein [Anaerolineales bacterium]